jgi:ATP-binding cassette, subfamily F, member 3
VQSGANVLILDEPTNHLDLESREALEQALDEFSGSLLLVSHDRALLDAVGTRTVAFEDRTLHSYVGGWPEYLRVVEERSRRPAAAKSTGSKAKDAASRARRVEGARARERQAPAQASARRQADLEREIEQAEAALAALEDELADPSSWATPKKSAESTERHEAAKRAVEELYSRWEKVAG